MGFFNDVGSFLKRATTPPASFNKTAVGKFVVRPVRQAIRYTGAVHAAPFLTAGQEKQAFGLTSRESKNVEVIAKVERGVIAAAATLLGGATLANGMGWGTPAASSVMNAQVPGTSSLYLGYGEAGAGGFLGGGSSLAGASKFASAATFGGPALSASASGSLLGRTASASTGLLSGLWSGVKATAAPVLTAVGLSRLLGTPGGGASGSGGPIETGGTTVEVYGDTNEPGGGIGTPGYFPGTLGGSEGALGQAAAPVLAAVGGFPGILLIGLGIGVYMYFKKR